MDPEIYFLLIFDRKMSYEELQLIIPNYELKVDEDWEVYYDETLDVASDDMYIDVVHLDYNKTLIVMPGYEILTHADIKWDKNVKPATFVFMSQVLDLDLFEYSVYEGSNESIERVYSYRKDSNSSFIEEGVYFDGKHFGEEDSFAPFQAIQEKILGFHPFSGDDFDIDSETDHYDLISK